MDNVKGSFAKWWSSITNLNEVEIAYPVLAMVVTAPGRALAALVMGQEGCPGPCGCMFNGPRKDLCLGPWWGCRARPAVLPWGRPWPVLRGKGPNTRAQTRCQPATSLDTHSSWGCWEGRSISRATFGPEVCRGMGIGRTDSETLGPSGGILMPRPPLDGALQPVSRPGWVRVFAAAAGQVGHGELARPLQGVPWCL